MRTTPLAHSIVLVFFLVNALYLPVRADELLLSSPGVTAPLIQGHAPLLLKGLKLHADNPLRFEFVMANGPDQKGTGHFNAFGDLSPSIKIETNKLIKYFLASLTIPEKDLWVNLSPYEKNRIVPDAFGQTEMGRDLLAQDYVLKQMTASLMNPDSETGKEFWKRVYAEAAKLGISNVPVSTFNKVWIVPDKAVVYENTKAGTAYVIESKLKVMMEEDYLAMNKNMSSPNVLVGDLGHSSELDARQKHSGMTSEIIRDIIIPELTREVNEGQHFAQLRQVYNSLILATWYKKKLKNSILNQVYSNKNKIKGTEGQSSNDVDHIYHQYLTAFKKGAYNLIKEEQDPITKQMIPRKYFSGGVNATDLAQVALQTTAIIDPAQLPRQTIKATVDLAMSEDLTRSVINNWPVWAPVEAQYKLLGFLTSKPSDKNKYPPISMYIIPDFGGYKAVENILSIVINSNLKYRNNIFIDSGMRHMRETKAGVMDELFGEFTPMIGEIKRLLRKQIEREFVQALKVPQQMDLFGAEMPASAIKINISANIVLTVPKKFHMAKKRLIDILKILFLLEWNKKVYVTPGKEQGTYIIRGVKNGDSLEGFRDRINDFLANIGRNPNRADEAMSATADDALEGVLMQEAFHFLTEPLKTKEYVQVFLGEGSGFSRDIEQDWQAYLPGALTRIRASGAHHISDDALRNLLREKIKSLARELLAQNSFQTEAELALEKENKAKHDSPYIYHEIVVPEAAFAHVPQSFFSFKEFTEYIMFHPVWGYYPSRAKIGEARASAVEQFDFSTYPEGLSPYFGRRMAEHAFGIWKSMGRIEHFDAVEFGAGNGTLARDFLTWARQMSQTDNDWKVFYDGLTYTVAEISPALRQKQKERLGEFGAKVEVKAVDARNIQVSIEAGSINGFIFSNELLDTMPPYKVLIDKKGDYKTAFVVPRVNLDLIRNSIRLLKDLFTHEAEHGQYLESLIREFESLVQNALTSDGLMREAFALRGNVGEAYLSKDLLIRFFDFFNKIAQQDQLRSWDMYQGLVNALNFEELYVPVDSSSELGQYLKDRRSMYDPMRTSVRRNSDLVIYVAPDEIKFIEGVNHVLNSGYHLLIDYGWTADEFKDNGRLMDLRIFPPPGKPELKHPYIKPTLRDVTRDINFDHLLGLPGLTTLFYGPQMYFFDGNFRSRGDLGNKITEQRDAFIKPSNFHMLFQQKEGTVGRYMAFPVDSAMNATGWVLNGSVSDVKPEVMEHHRPSDKRMTKEIIGLEKKVVINLEDGRKVLVTDDHNHAFTFWWLMIKQNILNDKGNAIFHIDAHADAELRQKFLKDVRSVLSMQHIEFKQVDELSMNLGIEAFIAPLFEEGFFSDWHWLYNLRGNQAVQMTKVGHNYKIGNSKSSPEDLKFDVLDIDLDVLAQGLSEEEIERNLDIFANLARKAKVISIVTSPGFMDQGKAIEYAIRLIRMIQSQQGVNVEIDTERNTGGIDFQSNKLNLETKSDGAAPGGIKLNIDPSMIKRLEESPGLTPVIINMESIDNLPVFLGFNQ